MAKIAKLTRRRRAGRVGFFPSLYLGHMLEVASHSGEGLHPQSFQDRPARAAQGCVSYLIPDPIKLIKFSHHTYLEFDNGSTFFFLPLSQLLTLKLTSPGVALALLKFHKVSF